MGALQARLPLLNPGLLREGFPLTQGSQSVPVISLAAILMRLIAPVGLDPDVPLLRGCMKLRRVRNPQSKHDLRHSIAAFAPQCPAGAMFLLRGSLSHPRGVTSDATE